MARKCKCGCGAELPSAAKSKSVYHKKKFNSIEHMIQFGLAVARKKLDQEEKSAIAAEKKYFSDARRKKIEYRAKDVDHQLGLTQKVFNQMMKLERILEFARAGEVPVCISCGKPLTAHNFSDFACGHFKTVGAQPALRFNTLNVELQCNRYCNKGLSGNIYGNKHSHGYLTGLALMFGEDAATDRLLYLERPHKNFTRNAAALVTVRKWCNARIRVLKQELNLE